MSGRRCLICRAASRAECAGDMDPRRTFAEPCGPFVMPTFRELWGSASGARHVDDDVPRGVPAYHPTEYQPIRVGGPET